MIISSNLKNIISKFLRGLEEVVDRGDIDAGSIGTILFCLHRLLMVEDICSIITKML